jgi:hypothetical protein
VAIGLLFAAAASAQEMEPRTFSPSPVGTNFVVFAVNHASGSVLVDPSLPVTDIHASNTVNVLGLGRVFDLFGRQALVTGVLPYANSDVTGNVGGNAREVQRSGLADAQAKLSVLLLGGKPLAPREFAQAHHGTVIGLSIAVSAPTGQYYPQYLINLGTNRWATRLEGGISIPRGRWIFEGSGGVGLFGDNDLFYPASAQEPAVHQGSPGPCELHLSPSHVAGARRHLVHGRPRRPGRRPGSGLPAELPARRDFRAAAHAATVAEIRVQHRRHHALRRDFNTFSVAYQLVWFGKRPAPPQVAPPPGAASALIKGARFARGELRGVSTPLDDLGKWRYRVP